MSYLELRCGHLFRLRKSSPPIPEFCAPQDLPEKIIRNDFQCLTHNGAGIPIGSLGWQGGCLMGDERPQQAFGG
jgi:hypothetical protein